MVLVKVFAYLRFVKNEIDGCDYTKEELDVVYLQLREKAVIETNQGKFFKITTKSSESKFCFLDEKIFVVCFGYCFLFILNLIFDKNQIKIQKTNFSQQVCFWVKIFSQIHCFFICGFPWIFLPSQKTIAQKNKKYCLSGVS